MTFQALMEELLEASAAENKFWVTNVVREMASRRGVTSARMAQAITMGKATTVTRDSFEG